MADSSKSETAYLDLPESLVRLVEGLTELISAESDCERLLDEFGYIPSLPDEEASGIKARVTSVLLHFGIDYFALECGEQLDIRRYVRH